MKLRAAFGQQRTLVTVTELRFVPNLGDEPLLADAT
jgi:hypothetical protein